MSFSEKTKCLLTIYFDKRIVRIDDSGDSVLVKILTIKTAQETEFF